MLLYTIEFNIYNFKFWSGAKDTINSIENADKMAELQNLIEETFTYSDIIPSDTSINDFVWFERDYIYEHLGIDENGEIIED